MKATTRRLVERDFDLSRTDDYMEQTVETYSKMNNRWVFIGWSVPSRAIYNVIGTKSGIFLEESTPSGDYRYRIKAVNMGYLDFED